MPIEYVSSGPKFTRDNRTIEPMATIYICDGCGYRGAAFVVGYGEHKHCWCGWKDGKAVCVGKARDKLSGG